MTSFSKKRILFFVLILIRFCLKSQEVYQVEILHADQAIMESINGETIKKLVGNCKLRHKANLIDCDSAIIFPNNNIDAFGHVIIRKNKTTRVEGDVLHYFSAQQLAVLNQNVILTDRKAKLYTEDITYDMHNDIGYYMTGGKLINEQSVITSQQGTYFSNSSLALFRQNVHVNHPKYNLTSDSLLYDTKLKRSIFKTSTKIENDSGYVWCNSGWHDEEKNQSSFGAGTYIYNPPHWLQTDSIYYDRKNGQSHIYKTFEYHDTATKTHLFGDSAYMFNDNKDIIAYKRPILILESINNQPTFIRGDILDIRTDSKKNKRMTSIGRVRLFSSDFQLIGDTMLYFSVDSSMWIKGNSFLWYDKSQISGNKILILLKNKKPERMNVYGNSFIASPEEVKTHYNQVSSDTNYIYFKNGKVDYLYAFGNAKSIYYGKEEGKGYLGLNSSESYSLKMVYDSTRPKKVTFYQQPKATFFPVKEINESNRFLGNFVWKEALRPKSKDDL